MSHLQLCTVCSVAWVPSDSISNQTLLDGYGPRGTPPFPWAPLESSHGLQRRACWVLPRAAQRLIYRLVAFPSPVNLLMKNIPGR